MSKPVPPGQQRILAYFADAEDAGRQPSRAEVADDLGYAFPSAVSKHVDALVRKNLLAAAPDKKRNVSLTARGWKAIARVPAERGVPVIGAIAAGTPILASEQHSHYLDGLQPAPGRIALLVRGDSMIDDGIMDGDYAVIQAHEFFPEDRIRDNAVYAVLVDGEATLKHVRRNKDRSLELIPANARYRPLHISGGTCRILGPLNSIYREVR